MTVLYYTLGVVIFVVAILVSIALHELGHMFWAKKFGGKVTQYFVGFGNTIWSKKVGETEYGFKAIPLGGFVKIVGMLPPEKDSRETYVDEDGNEVERLRQSNTGMFTQLISDARAAEWETVKAEDSNRLFYKMPWWKKVIVMGAGPAVNIAIAFVIFGALFATYGNIGEPRTTPEVSGVQPCVVKYEEAGRACTADDPESPAQKAGLRTGDRILSFNGTTIGDDWDKLSDLIRDNGEGKAVIVVDRGGESKTLTTHTVVSDRPTSTTDETLEAVGFLGFVPTAEPTTGGLLYTVDTMGTMTVQTVEALVHLPSKVWGVGKAIVGLEKRDPEGPMSLVGGGRIAGETAAHEAFPVKEKLVMLLMLIAGFNFFIGMFNFVPLLPLDGGHIAGATYEGLRRGWARLRRRPDPGYVDVAKLLPIAYVVASAFLVMSLVLIVGDLVVPIHLT
ncbi:PDZ domain-containing protein [Nocardioides sp. JQ2195]|uniref:M50 family metallopeptidase n=1 Tax=Nocardioides sp. JQ2195 TaxID=2592334 RepID=UPI00143E6617|nr:site-2 protease family protein [Nocardioides sp. JQ2195]QIX26250.1 PDZ domain-containing protein [Nocardioides sp. JQ2195]